MAYVAISGELLSRVDNKIARMKKQEMNTIGERPDSGFDENNPYFLSLMWGEHLHLKDTLPEEFLSTTKSIAVYTPYATSQIVLALKGRMLTPPHRSTYMGIDEFDWKQPEVAELLKWLTAEDEINTRWRKTKDDVNGFLKKCKSLNEAVKLWPAVEAYIDSQDISRMNIKKEKTEKVSAAMEALKGLDTDALVANAVIARMSGG